MEERKDAKTVELMLLKGSKKRFVKEDILAVYERQDLSGGVDTVVQTKSGIAYAVVGSKGVVERFINGE